MEQFRVLALLDHLENFRVNFVAFNRLEFSKSNLFYVQIRRKSKAELKAAAVAVHEG